jgi:hypothetical protein
MRLLYITAILFFAFAESLTAGVLKGKVTDNNGVSLPYATLFVEGTTIGVTTNGNGDYELSIAPGLHKVVCQYIGYKRTSFNVNFTGNETIEHNFILKDESLEMKEVVIKATAEDPAYAIIRNAIKKRKFHLGQVRSFQTGIYFKGVARSRKLPEKFMGQKVNTADVGADSSGKGVLFLVEEDADYYSQGDKDKTVIHSVHQSGSKSGLGFSQFPPVITFYENNVNVMGKDSRGFISPISDNALFYYKYKLLGEFKEHGHTIYKIQVIQKRNYEPCFNGIIYIVDDEWAIHSLDMSLTKESGIDMFDTLKINQLFLPLHEDTWVIKSQVLYFTLKFMAFDLTANGVTVYSRQKVNEALPDSIFANKIISAYDKTANKKDTSYWHDRPVPLQDDEKRDFVVKDSVNEKLNSFAYKDSIRRRGNRPSPLGFVTEGYTYVSKKNKNYYSINPIIGFGDNMVNYNIVEGFNVAPKVNWKHMLDTAKYLYTDAVFRHGFSNAHFNAMGRIYYLGRNREWLNRLWLFGAEGGKYVFQYNPDNPVMPWYNTYEALFLRQNDLKIYERWEASGFARRNYGNGLTWYARASFQQRLPLENTTTYSFIKGGQEGFTSNAPLSLYRVATAWEQHNAVILTGSISYKPGYSYIQYPDYKVATGSSWPRFTLQYQKGVAGLLESKTDFDKWKFSVQDDLSLKLLGSFSYNIAAGGFLNTRYVSFPDLIHLNGNRGIGFASPYLQSFQFAPYYDFSNKTSLYGEGHVEYHLNGLLTNKIPLLRQLQYYLVLGGNAFYAGSNLYYTEAFVGIENIGWKLARILRIDFVQSWDSNMGRNSGIRFGFSGKGFSANRNSVTNSEW